MTKFGCLFRCIDFSFRVFNQVKKISFVRILFQWGYWHKAFTINTHVVNAHKIFACLSIWFCLVFFLLFTFLRNKYGAVCCVVCVALLYKIVFFFFQVVEILRFELNQKQIFILPNAASAFLCLFYSVPSLTRTRDTVNAYTYLVCASIPDSICKSAKYWWSHCLVRELKFPGTLPQRNILSIHSCVHIIFIKCLGCAGGVHYYFMLASQEIIKNK